MSKCRLIDVDVVFITPHPRSLQRQPQTIPGHLAYLEEIVVKLNQHKALQALEIYG
jgi:hypothetical protein